MTLRLRTLVIGGVFAAASFTPAATAAQSFAIGPRLSFIRGSSESPEGTQRFSGGAIRLGGGRTALELAMDYRSGLTGDLTERIKDYPIQASLLVFPVRARIAPYLLAGVGWYSQTVESVSGTGPIFDTETTRKMGYHAGFGGEVKVHRRIGLYGDYRYTFIHFGDEQAGSAGSASTPFPGWVPFAERLKLSHEGSMFTWGATFYF